MFDHRHYVPILKWQQGEYLALEWLSESAACNLTPLFEVPKIGYDFEQRRERKTADEHLADFGKRLSNKWGERACFVDISLLPPETRMQNGLHPMTVVLGQARARGCIAIPVIRVSSDEAYRAAVAEAVALDDHGVCLRLSITDCTREHLDGEIEALLGSIDALYIDTDLVLDLGALAGQTPAAFLQPALHSIDFLPNLRRWRTFTIAASSYPKSIVGVEAPYGFIERWEWYGYKQLLQLLSRMNRIPAFGDYGVSHPDHIEGDMRHLSPVAKLRYTIEHAWYVGRGTPTRRDGYGQYRSLCAALVGLPYFDGADFSAGDRYIVECAAGRASTGNPTKWVCVSTNRHLTRVVVDLANLYGLSAAA